MKRLIVLILALSLGVVFYSCGKDNVKPDGNKTNTVKPLVQDDKFDDTAYKNVVQVLKEALDRENKMASVKNKYEAGRAFLLVAKFIKENAKDTRYGFTKDDLSTYKNAAIMRFNDVINSSASDEQLKSDASAQRAKAQSL